MSAVKKKIIISLILLFAISASSYALFRISKSRTFQFFGKIIYRVDADKKIIALTFDDAPTSSTPEILRILAEKNIKATFYTIGQAIENHPELAQEIVRQGHELGNHSFSHQRFIFKSFSFVRNEIGRTDRSIRDAGYSGEITFRPPNGKKLFILPLYLWRHNIKTIMWDVEPDTFHAGDAEKITGYALDNAKPGSIILLHPFCGENCQADRDALPKIIDGLKAKGYEFVTINKLLQYK